MNRRNLYPVLISLFLFCACSNNSTTSETPDTRQAVVSNTATETKGKKLFEEKCSACHGNGGAAGIGHAANLQISKLDSRSIAQTVSNGRGAMPSFKHQLTETEMAELAIYVLSLRK